MSKPDIQALREEWNERVAMDSVNDLGRRTIVALEYASEMELALEETDYAIILMQVEKELKAAEEECEAVVMIKTDPKNPYDRACAAARNEEAVAVIESLQLRKQHLIDTKAATKAAIAEATPSTPCSFCYGKGMVPTNPPRTNVEEACPSCLGSGRT